MGVREVDAVGVASGRFVNRATIWPFFMTADGQLMSIEAVLRGECPDVLLKRLVHGCDLKFVEPSRIRMCCLI